MTSAEIGEEPVSAPNGGSARVIDERAESQKVTLSWAPMRPDRVVHLDAEGQRAADSGRGQSRAGVHLSWAQTGARSHTRAGFPDLQPRQVRCVAG